MDRVLNLGKLQVEEEKKQQPSIVFILHVLRIYEKKCIDETLNYSHCGYQSKYRRPDQDHS